MERVEPMVKLYAGICLLFFVGSLHASQGNSIGEFLVNEPSKLRSNSDDINSQNPIVNLLVYGPSEPSENHADEEFVNEILQRMDRLDAQSHEIGATLQPRMNAVASRISAAVMGTLYMGHAIQLLQETQGVTQSSCSCSCR